MKSMTGYGKGVSKRDKKTLTVELKAVNNRFLEINARLPRYLIEGDDIIRKEISSVIRRGSVDVYFDYKNDGGEKSLSVDYELAKLYLDAAKQFSERLGVENSLSATDLLKLNEVVTVSSESEIDILLEMLRESVKIAVTELDVMRCKEGESVKRDFIALISNLSMHLEAVKVRAPMVVSDYREKLKKRIGEYLGEIQPDEARLMNEVAFFADKADINEEINRLSSHIEQFYKSIEMQCEVGRKLDFLTQEMNREINTIGSKSNDIELTSHVVAMKNELEKIKEQVRNVE